MNVCTIIKKLDTRTRPFMIQQIPRDRQYTAESEFRDLGELLEACSLVELAVKKTR